MIRWPNRVLAAVGMLFLLLTARPALAGDLNTANTPSVAPFPPPLESYHDADLTGVWDVLVNRVQQEPFNLWASLLFLAAVLHTFLTHRFIRLVPGAGETA